jgi:UDP-glucose 4-epimerase
LKYVVTGGAGFIGSHLTAALLERGHDVTVVDNLFSGKRENLEDVESSLQADSPGELMFVEADILDAAEMEAAVEGAAAVFHQAAIASVPRSFADPAPSLRVNIEGTAQLLEACRLQGVRRFVMASSSSLYGDTPTLPKHEGMPLTPLSPYALSKATDEHLLSIWNRQYGLETVGLRYFNIFGPRQDPNSDYAAVIPKFITRMLDGKAPLIYGDGMQSRDFTYIDNAVMANLYAGGVDGPETDGAEFKAGGAAMNIGIGDRYTLLDLVVALNGILGTSFDAEHEETRVGDVRDSMASIERARELIGYDPAVDFQQGLERTAGWYTDRFKDTAVA